MQVDIQVKPFEPKNGIKYKVIQITDFTFHTADKVPTSNIGKAIQKSFRTQKPGRIYSKLAQATKIDDHTYRMELLKMDPNFIKMVQEEEAKGYKVVIAFPKDGVPVLAGNDTGQFLESINGGRLTRGFTKDKKE